MPRSITWRYCGPALALAATFSVDGGAAGYPDLSTNDFGGVGLLQTPSARFAPDSEFRFGASTVYPYNQILLGLQWLPWLETGFRYTEIRNRDYGPESFSGNQTYKDRSIDFKLRLLEESGPWPALAFGFRDLGGTGLFASEYLVASRQAGDFDWSLGVAWGRMGARGGIRNPFAAASHQFDDRPRTEARGDLGLRGLLGGHDIGPFGGVQWQTPIRGVSLKLEYDGNDYKSEALDNDRDAHSPINVAINWRAMPGIDLAVGLERGDTFMARLAFSTRLAGNRGPDKTLDAPPTPQRADKPEHRAELARADRVDEALFARIRSELARQEIQLVAMDSQELTNEITVWFTQSLTDDEPRVIGRVGQTLATLAPKNYYHFTMVHVAAGAEGYRVTVPRQSIDDAVEFRSRPVAIQQTIYSQPTRSGAMQQAAFQFRTSYPTFDWYTGPAARQHIGGPDDFYFGQLWWRLGGSMTLSPRWSFGAQVGANIYNNFDGLKQESDSTLPHVRSDIVKYLKEGENNLVRLETNYIWSPYPSWYARLSAGIFEEMYGGVASEVLYRRPSARWALGLDVNHVRQRDYDQRFDFRNYDVTTAHLTAYFDLPFYNMSARVSAGRYLARDEGGTVEVSRRFDSGVVAGVFATKTNVSSADFGEGNFDKGIFLVVPFDLFFAKSTRKSIPLVFRPLTRDGGQRVRDGIGLFGITESGRLDPDSDWSTSLR